jgi:diaminopimelate decarboxylase
MDFLKVEQAKYIDKNFETPVYVYSEKKLLDAVNEFLAFPSAY